MPARHVCAVIGSAIVNTLIGPCNISIRRAGQSRSVITVELYANPGRLMSVVIVAPKRSTPRALVLTRQNFKTTVVVAMAADALVPSRRTTWIPFASPTLTSPNPSQSKEGRVHTQASRNRG